jgi:peptide deformylase
VPGERYHRSVPSRGHDIVWYPDPVLKRRAEPVGAVDDGIRALVEDMFAVMREEEGLGLAAPQVGRSLRIFITEEHEQHPARVFINPRLIAADGPVAVRDEGCLSLPGIRVGVRRPAHVRIEALGLDGERFELEDCGLMGRCWLHEHDHLEGRLITDWMSPIDRLAARRALRDLEAAYEEGR